MSTTPPMEMPKGERRASLWATLTLKVFYSLGCKTVGVQLKLKQYISHSKKWNSKEGRDRLRLISINSLNQIESLYSSERILIDDEYAYHQDLPSSLRVNESDPILVPSRNKFYSYSKWEQDNCS